MALSTAPCSPTRCARPKSVTTTRSGWLPVASSSMTLLLLKSRWTMPAACAAASAAAICRAIEQRVGGREPALALEPLRQRLAVQQLHRDERGRPASPAAGLDVLEQVEDAADVRVGDLAGELHLAQEALRRPLVAGDLGADRLERDALAERQVLGLVELAHAAAGDEAHDAEAGAQDVARAERRDRIGGARLGIRAGRRQVLAGGSHSSNYTIRVRRGLRFNAARVGRLFRLRQGCGGPP